MGAFADRSHGKIQQVYMKTSIHVNMRRSNSQWEKVIKKMKKICMLA